MTSVAERLTQARKNAGYTPLDAARLSGVPQFAIRSFEVGAAEPDRLELRRLCVLYGGKGDFWMGRQAGSGSRSGSAAGAAGQLN
jgi:hypothetical protein